MSLFGSGNCEQIHWLCNSSPGGYGWSWVGVVLRVVSQSVLSFALSYPLESLQIVGEEGGACKAHQDSLHTNPLALDCQHI